jgi:RNAse (barnase) inhibitor barstar
MMRIDELAAHLRSTKSPWVVLLSTSEFRAQSSWRTRLADACIRTIDGGKCVTKRALFAEFKRQLKFPSYFGRNWDAFEECLTDLEWLPGCGYVIVVRAADKLLSKSENEYRTFLDIVGATAEHWATPSFQPRREPVSFHVVFVAPSSKMQSRRWGVPRLDVVRTRH